MVPATDRAECSGRPDQGAGDDPRRAGGRRLQQIAPRYDAYSSEPGPDGR